MTRYRIVPKRDFPRAHGNHGFWERGQWINQGYVVTDGACNIMPGATWFRTIPEAMRALWIWCGVHGDAQAFWRAIR
jgi:hypothetical protein